VCSLRIGKCLIKHICPHLEWQNYYIWATMGFSGYASDLKYFFWQLTQSFFALIDEWGWRPINNATKKEQAGIKMKFNKRDLDSQTAEEPHIEWGPRNGIIRATGQSIQPTLGDLARGGMRAKYLRRWPGDANKSKGPKKVAPEQCAASVEFSLGPHTHTHIPKRIPIKCVFCVCCSLFVVCYLLCLCVVVVRHTFWRGRGVFGLLVSNFWAIKFSTSWIHQEFTTLTRYLKGSSEMQ